MSYYLEYNPELRGRYPTGRTREKKHTKIIASTLVIVAVCYVLHKTGLLRYLIPGDPEATADALRSMVELVGEGVAIKDAFANFCREIIVGVS